MVKVLLSKAEVNSYLKSKGFQYIYRSDGEIYGYKKPTKSLIKDASGKRIVGCRVASISPLTVSNAHGKRMRDFLYELRNSLLDEVSNCTINNYTDNGMDVTIEFDNSKQTLYSFRYELYRTYTYGSNLDPLYMTYWLTVSK